MFLGSQVFFYSTDRIAAIQKNPRTPGPQQSAIPTALPTSLNGSSILLVDRPQVWCSPPFLFLSYPVSCPFGQQILFLTSSLHLPCCHPGPSHHHLLPGFIGSPPKWYSPSDLPLLLGIQNYAVQSVKGLSHAFTQNPLMSFHLRAKSKSWWWPTAGSGWAHFLRLPLPHPTPVKPASLSRRLLPQDLALAAPSLWNTL